MRVLFSNAPWNENGQRGIRAGSRWPELFDPRVKITPYPYWLGYACTYNNGIFRDSVALGESEQDYLKEVNNYDAVVFETSVPSFKHDLKLIDKIRKPLILVGPGVNRDLLSLKGVIGVVVGEYEKGVKSILRGETDFVEFNLLSSSEMNESPFPYYSEEYYKRYHGFGLPNVQSYPYAQVLTSRGCAFSCSFCSWPKTMSNRKVRFYNNEYLGHFLYTLKNKYNIKHIFFDDDTFNLNTEHVLMVCDIMKKLSLPWTAMCRLDTTGYDIWKVMKDSGCRGVAVGIESGSQEVIDTIIKKKLNLSKVKDIVFHLRKLGLDVHGTFMHDLPGETDEQKEETRVFMSTLPLTSSQYSCFKVTYDQCNYS